MQQVRNYCRECKREWLDGKYVSNNSRMTITGNPDNGVNCIYCGSPETEVVSYNNEAGFDIPRDRTSVIVLPKQETLGIIDRMHIRSDIPKPLLKAMETMEQNNLVGRDQVEEDVKHNQEITKGT